MKYILVLGGVISGVGKGVIASSTGLLLKTLGLKVTAIKIDPYYNQDAGTMSPIEHGEVFVLNDGAEVDLDLGNYERFLDVTLRRDNNITSGKVHKYVAEKERRGDYDGASVQFRDLTDAVQEWIERVARIPVDPSGGEPDVCIIELGGTIGDEEARLFLKALGPLQRRVGYENFAVIAVSLVPIVGSVGEQKSRPTQDVVQKMSEFRLSPDVIACRCSEPLEPRVLAKIARSCDIDQKQVFSVPDVPSTYHVPILLKDQGILTYLTKRLNLDSVIVSPENRKRGDKTLHFWKQLTVEYTHEYEPVIIALIGKYTYLHDSYLSVVRALEHASLECGRKLCLKWVEATDLDQTAKENNSATYEAAWASVRSANGILVPGGFGSRGIEGKIAAAKYARENKIPYLGICLGLQVAVIEFARSVCGMIGVNSEELDGNAACKVIIYMPEISRTHIGGTMRLGLRPTKFQKGVESWSKIFKLYKLHKALCKLQSDVSEGATATETLSRILDLRNQASVSTDHMQDLVVEERHRHRYEVNPEHVQCLEANGLKFVGRDETGKRMEILELQDHPYFVATQYHPEYLTRPLRPVPTFLGFVSASSGLSINSILAKYLPN